MKQIIKVHSYGAMALGILFAGATSYVLLEDVLHGAAITTSHILTAVALVGTIASGHMALPHLKQGRLLAALGLGVLFLAGTAYTLISAGARNAEVSARKAEQIIQVNADRAGVLSERQAARAMLDEERALLVKECKSGAGSKCRGIQQSIAVYAAAVAGHDARLERLGPMRSANAGMAHAAKVFAAVSGVPASSIESRLVMVMPFLLVLVVELGTLTFWSVALGCETFVPPAPPADRAPIPEREETDSERVADFVKRYREKHGVNPSQSEIRSALDLPKATCWRIYHELRLAA
jgi:hypothetical protein